MFRRSTVMTLALASSVVGAVTGLAVVGSGAGRASTATPCPPGAVHAFAGGSIMARGSEIAAAVDGSIVMLEGTGARQAFDPPAASAGVPRHVSTRAGIGTAYVEDLSGSDVLVVATPKGVTRLPQTGEATHPAWSSRGEVVWSTGSELRTWSPRFGVRRAIRAPQGTDRVFSPVYPSWSEIVAVVAEHVAGPDGDAALDNVWSYDTRGGTWLRLTEFTADADRWSIIRTPIVAQAGSVEFVRIEGSASATQAPRYELWTLRGGVETKVRDLPGEMYLAGYHGGGRVWNVFDEAAGDWRLLKEIPDGGMADLGCGRVMVDPLVESDPDREPPPGSEVAVGSDEPAGGSVAEIGILVGDFSSREAAQVAFERILSAYGPQATVAIVDDQLAPGAVAPGVLAVVLRLELGLDPEAALEDFRSRLPEYAGWSWMVSI